MCARVATLGIDARAVSGVFNDALGSPVLKLVSIIKCGFEKS